MLLSGNNAQNNVRLSVVMPSVAFNIEINKLSGPFYYYFPECLNAKCCYAVCLYVWHCCSNIVKPIVFKLCFYAECVVVLNGFMLSVTLHLAGP